MYYCIMFDIPKVFDIPKAVREYILWKMNYERCSVTFFLLFKSKFPDEYCYWYCYWCSSDVWYKNQTTGVNTINTMLNRMKRVTPLAELCANKKITNHSGKETAVRKLIFLDFQKMWNKKKEKHHRSQLWTWNWCIRLR